jgi:hypothetical protein
MDGGNTFGYGVHEIQGVVVSHLWVCCTFIFDATFFQAYLFSFIVSRCFQVEAKVGVLPKNEKLCPS